MDTNPTFSSFLTPEGIIVAGALITALVLLAMLPWFAGLLVVGPVIGHASWHAYRDLVELPAEG